MLLSLIPYQDRYHLILVQKLLMSIFSIFILLNIAVASASQQQLAQPNFILNVDDYPDFSFGQTTNGQSCESIQIDLSNNSLSGILHSPNYRRSTKNSTDNQNASVSNCNWSLRAPYNYHFEIIIIDYDESTDKSGSCSNDSGIELKFTTDHPGLLAIDLKTRSAEDDNDQEDAANPFSANQSQVNTNYPFTNNGLPSLTNCHFPFRSFMRLVASTNRVNISYSSRSRLKLLVSFRAYVNIQISPPLSSRHLQCNTSANEMPCQADFLLLQQPYTQLSCINKELICNCLSMQENNSSAKTSSDSNKQKLVSSHALDTCDYLIETFENYLLSLQQSKRHLCSYYLSLNRKCLQQEQQSKLEATQAQQLAYLRRVNEGISLVENKKDENEPDLAELETSSKSSADMVWSSPTSSTAAAAPLGPTDLAKVCTNIFRANEFGWIASPNLYQGGPNSNMYPADINCSYHIILQAYQTVQLRFKYFYLRASLPNSNGSSDSDSLTLYDGPTTASPVLAQLTASHNDYARYLSARTFNSKSNIVLAVFQSRASESINNSSALRRPGLLTINQYQKPAGFNFTYQIKGLCIEDQRACNSLYELNCFSSSQVCNDVWDCQNGADERGCEPCAPDKFKCRNHIFCFRADERCDGDHHCTDKSDELNCDRWQCNAANGTFLCANGRCIYEQWQCDGTVDCEDGSDELNCASAFSTRRVITTAVLGGTLCCLLLVMALGCACKLYTLHTVSYQRASMRLTPTSSPAVASIPLINSPTASINSVVGNNRSGSSTRTRSSNRMRTILRGFVQRRHRHSSTPLLPTTATSATITSLLSSSRNNHQNNHHNNHHHHHHHHHTNDSPASASADLLDLSPPPSTNTALPTTSSPALPAHLPPPVLTQPSLELALPPPHHLIAPPTYNQTMGLVDEYEQRQLAFLEHVRSILSQQQQQQQQQQQTEDPATQLASLNLMIPTVASSSTTVVHRVTSGGGHGVMSNSSGRRLHSTRHGHRHHYRHRTSGAGVNGDVNSAGVSGLSDPTAQFIRAHHVCGGSSSGRHHRHRLSRSGSGSGHALSSSGIGGGSGTNYDANRRGLQFVPALLESATSGAVNSSSSSMQPISLLATNISINNNNNPIQTAPSTSEGVSHQRVISHSVNLRNKIARLIKDIVVNNNNNANVNNSSSAVASSTMSNNTNNNNTYQENLSEVSAYEQIAMIPAADERRGTAVSSVSSNGPSNGSGGTSNEDDVPLIQP